MVGQLLNLSCLTERRAPLYQIKVGGIGSLKRGMTDGADTVKVKIIEARSSGPYLARAGTNCASLYIPTVTKTYP